MHENSAKLACAVCAQIKVKSKSKEKIEFSLVWNMPIISFIGNQKSYKRYTLKTAWSFLDSLLSFKIDFILTQADFIRAIFQIQMKTRLSI